MKRFIFLVLTILFVVIMTATVAFAADSSPGEDTSGSYMTWSLLGTMAGAVAATTLITQFLKLPLDKVWKIPTRYLVYIIALLILVAVEVFTDQITAERVILCILNAVIVAAGAMGTYETTFRKLESKVPT